MLADGIHKVCRKNDSHALWWFETITHGPAGIFLRPSIFQVTPQIIFREFKINKIHFDAIDWRLAVDIKGYKNIIISDVGINVMYKIRLNIKLLSICNLFNLIFINFS